MLVEHTFVTTLDAPEAMTEASRLLQQFGFVAKAQTGFQIGGVWNALEVARGAAKFRYRKGVVEWPQNVRVEWDRGRVDVAAAITPPPRGRLDSNPSRLGKKEAARVQQLLVAIAQSLEMLLAQRLPSEQAAVLWAEAERQIEEQARRDRRRYRILMAILLGIVVLLIGLAVFMAITNGGRRF